MNDIHQEAIHLKKMNLLHSFAIYIPAALLMYLLTKYLIPYLSYKTGWEVIIFWFIVGGLGIFVPLIITGLLLFKSEGNKLSKDCLVNRLRFKKLSGKDCYYSFIGLFLSGLLSWLVMQSITVFVGNFDHSPPFMSFEPLTHDRYWILLLWLPYWILNIIGEEFLWRGVILPRQEVSFGINAWIIHSIGWGLFHIAFGWQLLLTLLPLIFILSYTVQKTKNSWVGVIMHGGLNGPSFLAISFGLI